MYCKLTIPVNVIPVTYCFPERIILASQTKSFMHVHTNKALYALFSHWVLHGYCERLRNFFTLSFLINCGQFWHFQGHFQALIEENFGILAQNCWKWKLILCRLGFKLSISSIGPFCRLLQTRRARPASPSPSIHILQPAQKDGPSGPSNNQLYFPSKYCTSIIKKQHIILNEEKPTYFMTEKENCTLSQKHFVT